MACAAAQPSQSPLAVLSGVQALRDEGMAGQRRDEGTGGTLVPARRLPWV